MANEELKTVVILHVFHICKCNNSVMIINL